MPKRIRIIKFGGSSLSAVGGSSRLGQVVCHCLDDGIRPVVVVSAFEQATNQLMEMSRRASCGDDSYREIFDRFSEMHKDIIGQWVSASALPGLLEQSEALLGELSELLHGVFLVQDISPRTSDLIASYGEQLSASIVTEYLSEKHPQSQYVDARKFIVTDESFGAATVDYALSCRKIQENLDPFTGIPVITGYIGSAKNGQTTTLGRGGSDYSAALVGAALKADEIQLWTSVDGVMTADPEKVAKAFTIPYLSYEEAMELCHFGARVIYPPTLQPAMDAGIPIRIKNSFNPEGQGSLITAEPPPDRLSITGISSISSVALLRLEGSGMIGVAGVARRLFDALSRERISVILISQASSEHSICFAVDPVFAYRAKNAIDNEFSLETGAHQIEPIKVDKNCSIVAVVGSNMNHTPGISGKLFQALGRNGINITAIAQGSSELNISIVISRDDESKALNALHDAFFLSELKTLNLFLVGTGQVGGTLLEQINRQSQNFKKRMLELRVVALADSKKMLFRPKGIDLTQWKNQLETSDTPMNVQSFVASVKQLNLPNSVFVDCTASSTIGEQYLPILSSSISIVTPNKKANSEAFDQYKTLKKQAVKANVKFFYETTVGAGLPVIGTLNDLILSGDTIVKIEAVLSGTLSYIFNSFASGRKFSEVVFQAKDKGYTEPDPRDDLNGTDVARKLLILAREIGFPLELEDIQVESLVPEALRESSSVEEFLRLLPDYDDIFEEKQRNAEVSGQVLRYIGMVESGRAQVSLQPVDTEHPFHGLSGSDNIISFVTQRYYDRPLVVKGPGAGTDVTAAGVLADIIRVASYLL